ncbi:rhomboid family intramembrane serine protease [Virgibacillus oceani]|uniref:rhomboid family intramembrane serine protease n=1 Tax=Virgibacillus oceani TaxID=1479511 RepID=UPI0027E3F085|nr:rhomboid family intramembrane serine protease [Virgibacillus oceani]
MKDFIRFYPIVSTLVIIHLALWFFINFLQLPIGLRFFQWGAGYNLGIHNGEYWRLVTPIFLHGDFMHALFNSFSLVLFGPALEQMLGKFKFLVAYFAAGIIGNLATYLIEPTAFYSHIGASGAIFGLFGVYVYMVLFRKDLIDQANAQIVMVISIIGLIMTFLRPGINIYAHIFGFIGGFALARILLSNVKPFSPWRNQSNRNDGNPVQFNSNRWNKRRVLPRGTGKTAIWIVLGILVLLGIMSRIL